MNSAKLTSSVTGALNTPFVRNLSRQRDLIIVLGVIGILVVMIIPIHTMLMDVLLSLNLCIALIILLVSMYTREALEFSVFPSLLLTITLFRLALNVATTRLILSRADAGQLVEVFGTFVTGGNIVVGLVFLSSSLSFNSW